ncbi:uridylate kinase [Kitasatospora acidiphila]
MNDEEAIAVQETVPVPAAVASSRVHAGQGLSTPGPVTKQVQKEKSMQETQETAPDGTRRRVLLKLSGEAFAGGGGLGVDPDVVHAIAREIATVVRQGTEVAVVIGGGNFFRGAELQVRGMDRARSDYMGMLGTVMNCLALQDFLMKEGIETRVQTAITMGQVAEPYLPLRAIRHLEKGRVVIFGAGMGMPYFSTDTTAVQRALEIHAEVLLMGKNGVDGVYDSDPKTNPDAVRFDALEYAEVISRDLKVADLTAITLCKDNGLPILVFELLTEGNIARAVRSEKIGTLISQDSVRA